MEEGYSERVGKGERDEPLPANDDGRTLAEEGTCQSGLGQCVATHEEDHSTRRESSLHHGDEAWFHRKILFSLKEIIAHLSSQLFEYMAKGSVALRCRHIIDARVGPKDYDAILASWNLAYQVHSNRVVHNVRQMSLIEEIEKKPAGGVLCVSHVEDEHVGAGKVQWCWGIMVEAEDEDHYQDNLEFVVDAATTSLDSTSLMLLPPVFNRIVDRIESCHLFCFIDLSFGPNWFWKKKG